jgi:hypothetical protein
MSVHTTGMLRGRVFLRLVRAVLSSSQLTVSWKDLVPIVDTHSNRSKICPRASCIG